MNSHREIIELWSSRADLAREVGVDYQTARQWHLRNSIPSEYWCDLVRVAQERGLDQISVDLLATIKAAERTRADLPDVRLQQVVCR